MKKVIVTIVMILPLCVFSQQGRNFSSPLNYMWMYVGNPGFSEESANNVCLAFSQSQQPYISFEDGPTYQETVKKYEGTGWLNVGQPGFSGDYTSGQRLVFSPGGQPYVAFQSGLDVQISVMKFEGTNWELVGPACFSGHWASAPSLGFNPADSLPYVAYSEVYTIQGKRMGHIKKFNLVDWVDVGSTLTLPGGIGFIKLAFSPTEDMPYVAYTDVEGNGLTVLKCFGAGWGSVGQTGFASGVADLAFAFSPVTGQPYVAYAHSTDPAQAIVMKFDGSNWVMVGNGGASAGQVLFLSLSFDPATDDPYIAFRDFANSYKATVMKYDGSEWINVGPPGFSNGNVAYTSLAISPYGIPFLAFMDGADSNKATVMKFDSVMVGNKEVIRSSLSVYPNPSSSSVTIDLQKTGGKIISVEITDAVGRRIHESLTPGTRILLNVETYSPGIYFVKLQTTESSCIVPFYKY